MGNLYPNDVHQNNIKVKNYGKITKNIIYLQISF